SRILRSRSERGSGIIASRVAGRAERPGNVDIPSMRMRSKRATGCPRSPGPIAAGAGRCVRDRMPDRLWPRLRGNGSDERPIEPGGSASHVKLTSTDPPMSSRTFGLSCLKIRKTPKCGQSRVDSAQREFAPHDGKNLENPRRHGRARQRQTEWVDQLPCPDPELVCEGPQLVLELRLTPFPEGGETIPQRGEARVDLDGLLPVLRHGGLVVSDLLLQIWPCLAHEVVEVPGARLEEVDERQVPRTPLGERVRGGQTSGHNARRDERLDLLRPHPADVLAVEPLELARVEDGAL